MTIFDQINQDLAQLDDRQLHQVAEFIATLKPISTQKKRLSDFYGALPTTQPYPGRDAIRQSTATHLAQKHHLTES